MIDMEVLAKAGFEAYRKQVGGVAVNGDHIPAWDDLDERIRVAWHAAAAEIVNNFVEEDVRYHR